TGRGRTAVNEHHQRWPLARHPAVVGIVRQVEVSVGRLTLPRREIQTLRMRQLGAWQWLLAPGRHADFTGVSVDHQHRRAAIRRASDAVKKTAVDRQWATAGIFGRQRPYAAWAMLMEPRKAVAHV